jgi:integrase
VNLVALMERRLAELDGDGLLFPAPRGGWVRRSNYGRATWDPAAQAAGWPRTQDRWVWSFHSLRHVFATWALHQPGLRLEDVSRFPGHSSSRVTQDVYKLRNAGAETAGRDSARAAPDSVPLLYHWQRKIPVFDGLSRVRAARTKSAVYLHLPWSQQ